MSRFCFILPFCCRFLVPLVIGFVPAAVGDFCFQHSPSSILRSKTHVPLPTPVNTVRTDTESLGSEKKLPTMRTCFCGTLNALTSTTFCSVLFSSDFGDLQQEGKKRGVPLLAKSAHVSMRTQLQRRQHDCTSGQNERKWTVPWTNASGQRWTPVVLPALEIWILMFPRVCVLVLLQSGL